MTKSNMANRYSSEVRARAVWMVFEHQGSWLRKRTTTRVCGPLKQQLCAPLGHRRSMRDVAALTVERT